MKPWFSSLALLCVMPVSLTCCVDLDTPTYGEPTVNRPRSVFGPDNSPAGYYNGGGFGRRGAEKPAEYSFGNSSAYDLGLHYGRHDHADRFPANYKRHEGRYEGDGEREFARGYNDGYNGR